MAIDKIFRHFSIEVKRESCWRAKRCREKQLQKFLINFLPAQCLPTAASVNRHARENFFNLLNLISQAKAKREIR